MPNFVDIIKNVNQKFPKEYSKVFNKLELKG